MAHPSALAARTAAHERGAPSRQDGNEILQLHPEKSETENTETQLNAGTFIFYKTNCFQ